MGGFCEPSGPTKRPLGFYRNVQRALLGPMLGWLEKHIALYPPAMSELTLLLLPYYSTNKCGKQWVWGQWSGLKFRMELGADKEGMVFKLNDFY